MTGADTRKPCDACESAKVRTSGLYINRCEGCMARAVARSLVAYHAWHPHGERDRKPLEELVAKLFTADRQRQARALVWAWWQHDHPQQPPEPASP